MSENLIFDIGANRGLVAEEFVNKGYKLNLCGTTS